MERVGTVGLSGQVTRVRSGGPDEELKDGMLLEWEPAIGAGYRLIDALLNVEAEGKRRVRMVTALTLGRGEPVVIPVGEEGGKKLGLAVECEVVDGVGGEMRP